MEPITNVVNTTNADLGRGTMTTTEYETLYRPTSHTGTWVAMVLVAIVICVGWLWLFRRRRLK